MVSEHSQDVDSDAAKAEWNGFKFVIFTKLQEWEQSVDMELLKAKK